MNIALIVPFWNSVVQRPHHWERQARQAGHNVVVFALPKQRGSDPETNHPEAAEIRHMPGSFAERIMERAGFGKQARDRFYRRWSDFIAKNVLSERHFDAAIYAGPPFLRWRKPSNGCLLVYDCMDEWTAFSDAPEDLGEMENDLAGQSELLLAVSPSLRDRLARNYPAARTVLIPNACDYERFAAAADLADSPQGKLGYVGTISTWFNWDFVRALASAQPGRIIELVGPLHNTKLPIDLPSNVHFLDRQPYEQMPKFMSQYVVGIIPFETGSRLVQAVSPIKLYEYLAAGRPVVSSPMPDVVQLAEEGIVHLANTPNEFVDAVRRAIELSASPERRERRRALARAHSWKARWAAIESAMDDLKRGRRPTFGGSTGPVVVTKFLANFSSNRAVPSNPRPDLQ